MVLNDAVDFDLRPHPQPRRKETPAQPVVVEVVAPVTPPHHSSKVALGTLGLDGQLFLDVDKLLETRLLVQASSGAGKSWLLRKILEESHGRVCQLVVDPEGEFGSLVEHYDYALVRPVSLFKSGGIAGAGELALRTLQSGRSTIVDLYDLEREERVLFVQGLLEGLMNSPKEAWRPLLVVVDEAHMFAPNLATKMPSAKPMIDLASRGRKRGFACIISTQRLSKLHKDVAAECLNKMIGRTTLERDLQRCADELGMRGNRANQLRAMKTGSFFVYGPALIARPEVAIIGPVKSTHCAKSTPAANMDLDEDETEEIELAENAPSPLPAATPRGLAGGLARKHCSACGESGHRRPRCPKLTAPAIAFPAAPIAPAPVATPAADGLEADLAKLEMMLTVASDMVAAVRLKIRNQNR